MLRMVAHISLFNMLVLGLTTLTSPVVARLLGPSGRGQLAIAMLWPIVLSSIWLFGADVTLGRMAARWPAAALTLRRLAVRLSLVLGLGAISTGCFAIPLVLLADEPPLWMAAFIVLAQVPCQLFVSFAVAIALSTGNLWGFNVPRFGFSAAYLALAMTLWIMDLGEVRYVALSFSLASALTTAVAFLMVRAQPQAATETTGDVRADSVAASQTGPEAVPTFSVGSTLRSSVGFGGAALLEAGSTHVPMALLSFLVSPTEIGFYAVSVTAASVQEAFGSAVGKALFTQVASGADEGTQVATRLRYTLLLYLVLALGMMVVIPPLMPLVFGGEYAASSHVVRWMIPAASLLSIARVYNETLKGAGQARPAMVARCVGPLVLTAIAFILVPRWGVVGMVAAVAGGACSQLVLFVRSTASHFAVPVSQVWIVRVRDVQVIALTIHALVQRFGQRFGQRSGDDTRLQ